jgi:transcription elongation GreA/GreB family factor
MSANKLKAQLLNLCNTQLQNRLSTIENVIADINNSLTSETKSSAGDKHETGRAMLQLEREKAGNQLAELQKSQEILKKIDTNAQHQKITLGSVVKTSQSNYFIAISAGAFKVDNETYYAISAATPIAQVLLSKQVGDVVTFRDLSFSIIEIQ